MRAVVQRVSSSKVTVDGEVTGEINKGSTAQRELPWDPCPDA